MPRENKQEQLFLLSQLSQLSQLSRFEASSVLLLQVKGLWSLILMLLNARVRSSSVEAVFFFKIKEKKVLFCQYLLCPRSFFQKIIEKKQKKKVDVFIMRLQKRSVWHTHYCFFKLNLFLGHTKDDLKPEYKLQMAGCIFNFHSSGTAVMIIESFFENSIWKSWICQYLIWSRSCFQKIIEKAKKLMCL